MFKAKGDGFSRAFARRAGAAPWERGRLALRSRFGEEWVPAAE